MFIKNQLFAAPLAGISDKPFRRIIRQFSPDVSLVTEMISCHSLVEGHKNCIRNFDDYKDDGKRPLVHSKEDLMDLYKKRHDIYDRMADITVDSSVDVDDLMREVCDALIMC